MVAGVCRLVSGSAAECSMQYLMWCDFLGLGPAAAALSGQRNCCSLLSIGLYSLGPGCWL
jgi:hypothetical protein